MNELKSHLNSLYLCRETQISQLCECLDQKCKTLIVYGLRSTAKTSVVKTLCNKSKSFHSYVNCNQLFTNKMIYENILIQLNDKINCFDSNQIHCNSLFDFIDCFKKILFKYNQKRELKTRETLFSQCILVFDSIDSNQDLINSNNSEIITALSYLQELSENICPISCVLISCQSIEWFSRITSSHFTAIQINFESYTVEQLSDILSKDCPIGYDKNFYQNYINIITKSLIQLTRDLNEIRWICLTRFGKYVEPITSGEMSPKDSAKLYQRFQPILSEINEEIPLKMLKTSHQSREWSESMKYLLIACYLSSYNSLKNDKKNFVKYEGKKVRQTKRKTTSEDNQCVGPKATTFERILHIFKALIELNSRKSDQLLKEPSNRLMSNFQELVSLKYIKKSVSQNKNNCLSSQTKYQISSSVTLDFIKDLSQKLDLNLKAFLQ